MSASLLGAGQVLAAHREQDGVDEGVEPDELAGRGGDELLHLGPGLRRRTAEGVADCGHNAGLRQLVLEQAQPQQFERGTIRC